MQEYEMFGSLQNDEEFNPALRENEQGEELNRV